MEITQLFENKYLTVPISTLSQALFNQILGFIEHIHNNCFCDNHTCCCECPSLGNCSIY